MRRTIAVLSALTMIVVSSGAGASVLQNLAKNPSFENAPGGVISDWTVVSGQAISTDHVAFGARAALLNTVAGGTTASITQTVADTTAVLKVVPGATYELKFSRHLIGAAGGVGTAQVQWKLADGTLHHASTFNIIVGGGYDPQAHSAAAPLDLAVTRVDLQFTLTVPAGAVAGAHDLYLDGVEFGLKRPVG